MFCVFILQGDSSVNKGDKINYTDRFLFDDVYDTAQEAYEAAKRISQSRKPVIQLTGVTPVQKNFNIGFTLVENEKAETYVWVLNQLRMFFGRAATEDICD